MKLWQAKLRVGDRYEVGLHRRGDEKGRKTSQDLSWLKAGGRNV